MNLEKLFTGKNISETEKKVLIYIIENISLCTKVGIRGVAKNNYTSTSTIMRLAKKLGYNGFVEMIYDLKLRISNEGTAEININNDVMFNELIDSDIFSIGSEEDINKFIEMIHKNNIFIYGSGFSELISQYIYKKLLALGRRIWLAHTLEFKTIINNYREDIDTVIVISKSGQTKYVVDVAKEAKQEGINVVCFTGSNSSELVKHSDIVFLVKDNNPFDDENRLPNSFFGYCIVLFEKLIGIYFSKYKS